MMTNLFSMFDPSSYMFSMSWTILIVMAMMSTKSKKFGILKKIFLSNFKKEIKSLSPKNNKMWIVLFWLVVTINLSSMNPMQFSINAHPSVVLPLSLTMWLGIIIFNSINNLKEFATHLLPAGTPSFLIFPMITIELVSNLIRPITLTIRMVANIMAGHLLMHLLANFAVNMSSIILLTSAAQLVLTSLEMAVAIIQAYIITVLLILYANEIH